MNRQDHLLKNSAEIYDTCIIGGGPAGLTAALYLARYHLAVTLVDAAESRAALIPLTHNQLFFEDGVGGSELLEQMRSHVSRYPVEIKGATVELVSKWENGFQVRMATGNILARTVLLSTGVADHRPSIDDELHTEALRRGLLRYCPICDGYEVTDRNVAVVGAGERLFGEAKFLRSFTSSVSVFTERALIDLSEDQRDELRSMNVNISDLPALNYRLAGEAIEVSVGGRWQAFDTMYAALGSTVRSDIIRDLGANMTEQGCLIVDAHQRTSVAGLYAAGDVVVGVDQIAHAMGQATVAATTIRNDLSSRKPLVRAS